MKNLIIILFILIFNQSTFAFDLFNKGGDPKFLKDYFLDGTLDEINKKYRGNVKPDSCNDEDTKACTQKKLNCSCYDVVIARTQGYAQDLYLTVANGKILSTFHSMNVGTRMYPRLQSLESQFGSEEPTKIYEKNETANGYRNFFVVWDIKDGYVMSSVVCPMNGKEYLGKVRDCKSVITVMSRLSKFQKSNSMTESKAKY